jgi:polysaccharide biosynthesis/export protein
MMSSMNSRKLSRLGGLCAAMVLVSGCATRGGSIPYNVQNFGVPDAPRAATPDASYRIASGDTLHITVYQVADLTRDYIVDAAGNIAIPLIGYVPAAGQTSEQLRAAIASRLNQRYLRNADVTVAIRESAGQIVTVDGAVQQPGQYPVRGPTSLIQAVALARGTNPQANPRRVAVFRQIDGQRMAAAFDLTSIRRGEAPDPQLFPGDIVVVDGNTANSVWQTLLQTLPLVALFRPY